MKKSKLKKSLIAIALILAISIQILSVSFVSAAGSTDVDYNTYTAISTKEELLSALKNRPNEWYYLASDIVFNDGEFWTPIGGPTALNAFNGILDGRGHKIVNLQVNTTNKDLALGGLFGYSKGIVRNLTIENAKIVGNPATSMNIGIIAGINDGIIENCTVSGKITTTSVTGNDITNVGGIVGKCNRGTITGCTSNVDIDVNCWTAFNYIGGIAGRTYYSTVTNNSNVDNIIKVNAEGSCYAGGVLGASDNDVFKNNRNTSDITTIAGDKNYTGGIVAYSYGGTIDSSYNSGSILAQAKSTTKAMTVGGACGYVMDNSEIINTYNSGDVTIGEVTNSTLYYAGSFLGSGLGTKISHSYSSGQLSINPFTSKISYIGAFQGQTKDGVITDCYYITSNFDALGTVNGTIFDCTELTTAQMKNASSFKNFDYSNVWRIDSRFSYKYPMLQNVVVDGTQDPDYKVSGYAYAASDNNGNGVVSTLLTAEILNNNVSLDKINVDENGYFEFTVAPGEYTLIIDSDTAFTKTLTFTVSKDVILSTQDKPFVVVNCDSNKDGFINASDYTRFININGSSQTDDKYVEYFDLNNDGFINAADYTRFMTFMGKSNN